MQSVLLHHIGKISGVALGAILFGFWGAVVGLLCGFAFDEWKKFLSGLKVEPAPPQPQTAIVLAVTVIARSYGLPAIRQPMQAIKILKQYYALDDATLRYLGKTMQSRGDEASLKTAMEELRGSPGPDILRHAFSCLLDLSKDIVGTMDVLAVAALERCARELGMGVEDFTALATTHGYLPREIYDPYQVLGLPTDAAMEAVTKAYRRLMQDTHPDSARHLSPALAQERAAKINDAYQEIKRLRRA